MSITKQGHVLSEAIGIAVMSSLEDYEDGEGWL